MPSTIMDQTLSEECTRLRMEQAQMRHEFVESQTATFIQEQRMRENIDIQQRDINDLICGQEASDERVEELVKHICDMSDEFNKMSDNVWENRRVPDRVLELEHKLKVLETHDEKLRAYLTKRFKEEDEQTDPKEKKQEQLQIMFQKTEERHRKELESAQARIKELELEVKAIKRVDLTHRAEFVQIYNRELVEAKRNNVRLDRLEKLLEDSAEENALLKKRISHLEGLQKD
ncbi:hypothetical protein K491DRAFT_680148 [Lophiostoma macrostomum CBS 122681]|uniref:Uncharacterized protein n=1 Tax=Lophiostoma macrostomum CBS 122681 TaxID=1314788 RepID=A0A6A6T1N0_9PLEO|nr:hypothetical protein K491DRAFT_680148 [Lophiostoma macrostomum CBS 122681]